MTLKELIKCRGDEWIEPTEFIPLLSLYKFEKHEFPKPGIPQMAWVILKQIANKHGIVCDSIPSHIGMQQALRYQFLLKYPVLRDEGDMDTKYLFLY